MKYILLTSLGIFFLMSSCSSDSENGRAAIETPRNPETISQEATLLPEISPRILESKNANQLSAPTVQEHLKRMPLQELFSNNMPFTENKGQLERFHHIRLDRVGEIEFYSQAFGGTAYFGEKGIALGFSVNQLNEKESGLNPSADEDDDDHEPKVGDRLFLYIDHLGKSHRLSLEGLNKKEGVLNYFKGAEKDFITDIANYEGVIYKNLYRNIDLKYSIVNKALVYDYIVKPGGSVSDICRSFEGVDKVEVNSSGELDVYTSWGILTDKKIYAYQVIGGREKEVKVLYKKRSKTTAGFEVVGKYDATKELIIDPPTLSFCTWVTPGGSNGYIHDVTSDATGIYACGWINGDNNASLVSPFDNGPAGGDAVVFKLNSTGTTLIYASFIGGDAIGGDHEVAMGVAVNAANQLYVTGYTNNHTGFPTAGTIGAPFSTTVSGSTKDIFIVKIAAAGNALIYSAIYGGAGDDRGFDVAVNPSSDQAFITGWTTSTGLASAGAYQTTKQTGGAFGYDAFVLKVADATAGTVTRGYFTYIGGTNEDAGRAIAVNSAGEAYITGCAQSNNFPRTVGATFGGGGGGGAYDAFIVRFNAAGTGLQYSTYIGGDFDERGEGIAVNASGEAMITGWTKSIVRAGAGTFPVLNALTGYAQNAQAGGNVRDSYLTRVDASGTILSSTFMGCVNDDNIKNDNPFNALVPHRAGDVAVDVDGNIAVTMCSDNSGGGTALPTVSSVDNSFGGGSVGLGDAYLFVLTPDAQTILFSTYFGGDGNDYATAGVEFDASSCVIVGGSSHSSALSTTAGVHRTTRMGSTLSDENYITKYCTVIPLPVEIRSFEVHKEENFHVLNWTTVTEINSDYFIVEKSTDGIHFYPIGQVKAAGNSQGSIDYSFVDHEPSLGDNYYRLNQFDFNGEHYYSEIRVLSVQLNFIVSSNPGDGLFRVEAMLNSDTEVRYTVFSSLGQEVLMSSEKRNKGVCRIDLDLRNQAEGMYTLRISAGSEIQTEKLLKR